MKNIEKIAIDQIFNSFIQSNKPDIDDLNKLKGEFDAIREKLQYAMNNIKIGLKKDLEVIVDEVSEEGTSYIETSMKNLLKNT